MLNLSKSDLLEMYRLMLLTRRFEEKTVELWHQGKIVVSVHSGIGHEAIGVGACYGLRPDDIIQPYYRTRAAWFVRGCSVKQMMADVFGNSASSSKGKSHYMHVILPEKNILNFSGVVGDQLPLAAGAALAIKLRKQDRVVVSFFGDGHVNTGDFHEALNFAAIWDLPVVYICENNEWAMTTHISESTAVRDISKRAIAYDIPGVTVDGTDVLAVYEVVQDAVSRARNGEGPSLIECKTIRLRPHCEDYRKDDRVLSSKLLEEEIKKLWERDPLKKFENFLKSKGILTDETILEMDRKIMAEIEEAVKYAETTPMPEPHVLFEDVYDEGYKLLEGGQIQISSEMLKIESARNISYRRAIREAIQEEMERDENVFIMGEDVSYGYYVTKNLVDKFGKERVRDTPISESAIVGLAIGAAMMGMRPIVEIMSGDFITCAFDQIVNNAAKMRYAYGGKISVPVVIRFPQGAGGHFGLVHSQSVHPWFMNIPGLKIVYPSTPFDAKGLMKAAIRDNNPVIFCEHRLLYDLKGPVPEKEYIIPIGKADVKREGDDVTVIAAGISVQKALVAAESLKMEKGISVEVIDLRTLLPIDEETILNSVKKTGRVVIVIEECKTGGSSAEVSALIAEKMFKYLKSPIKRVCNPFTPIPFSPRLEEYWMSFTDVDAIKTAICEIVGDKL
jgi:2-oxoisovalerate dehydrogenase E1 component